MTALSDELEAVLAVGDGGKSGWKKRQDPTGLPYHTRSVQRDRGRPLRLAVAWSVNMGEVPTVDRARALAQHLSPRWLAMCGICAGRPREVSLGDVIVADRVFSYDHGKLIASTRPDGQRQEEIFRDITTYNLRDPWFTKVAYFVRELAWSNELARRRPVSLEQQSRWVLRALLDGEDPQHHVDRPMECPDWTRTLRYLAKRGLVAYPQQADVALTAQGRIVAERERIELLDSPLRDLPFRVHLGPIATGKTVREDPEIFKRINDFSRKAIGIETEAAAIGYVAERLGVPSLIAKAVSDFADEDKDDGFRKFACEASAMFVLAFFLSLDLENVAASTTSDLVVSTIGDQATPAETRPSHGIFEQVAQSDTDPAIPAEPATVPSSPHDPETPDSPPELSTNDIVYRATRIRLAGASHEEACGPASLVLDVSHPNSRMLLPPTQVEPVVHGEVLASAASASITTMGDTIGGMGLSGIMPTSRW
jgi:nucleoside phosphorylase